MKRILMILLLIILVGCHVEIEKTEEDLIKESNLFQNAYQMHEKFFVKDIQAEVVEVITSPTFIGNNKNQGMAGVRIYLDYAKGEQLSSSLFSVLDLDNNEYFAITADGLDFLGPNRGEHGNEIGYYRVSLPLKYQNFLLKYDDDGLKYVHIVVQRGE